MGDNYIKDSGEGWQRLAALPKRMFIFVLALAFSLLSRRLTWKGFVEAVSQTVRLSAMIFLVVIGGRMFGFFLSATGIPRALGGFIGDLEVAGWVVAAAILLLYVVLGAFMDEIAIP
jgi:TRAP-type C4-dicarboxylate transport system permease large subunit